MHKIKVAHYQTPDSTDRLPTQRVSGSSSASGTKLTCAPNPCNTCPYRRDTPVGIWHQGEYDKLPQWDEQMAFAGIFLCHNNPSGLCRGWVEVHNRNMAVRIAMAQVEWNESNLKPTKVPLYRSGSEARRAGLKGIRRPNDKARQSIQKLLARREQGSEVHAAQGQTLTPIP